MREPDALAPCMEAVELEFVHGYRAHDTRNNLFYSARGMAWRILLTTSWGAI